MNVGDSVKHSLDHWDLQEWDAAMLHACNAVDGTGKKRYPKLGVGSRFKRTIRDALDIFGAMALRGIDVKTLRFPISSVKSDLPDKRPDIADVLYGVHRCTRNHGDELPEGFELTPHMPEARHMRIGGNKVRLPASAVLGLLAVAVFAPENKGQDIPEMYTLGWCQHVFHICGWWGWQDHFREIISDDQFPVVTIDWPTAGG